MDRTSKILLGFIAAGVWWQAVTEPDYSSDLASIRYDVEKMPSTLLNTNTQIHSIGSALQSVYEKLP